MSGNMFLKIENIHGESLDEEHKHDIEVEGWKWGLNNNAPFRLDESKATPQTGFDYLSIDKYFDHASLTLAKFCAHGRHIPEATLICRKNTGEKAGQLHAGDQGSDTFLQIKLTDVKVESLDWPGSKDSTGPILETVTFSFLEVSAEYKKQRQTGGLHAANHFHFKVSDPDKSEGAGGGGGGGGGGGSGGGGGGGGGPGGGGAGGARR
jgi:type VI secretion system secreted protein Hcp